VNIVYVVADSKEEWNSAEWRCVIPARAIQRSGRHSARLTDITAFVQNTPEVQEICKAADIIVVQRNLFGPVLNAIQRWKARDKVVIADFDDAYQLMPPTNKNYPFWVLGQSTRMGPDHIPIEEKLEPPPLTQFKWGLRLVNAATAPSQTLAEDWRAYTDMYYLPNYIELDRYYMARPTAHEGITIGWGGSLSHLQSFTESGVLTALKSVCRSRPRVRVMICGDQRVYNQIPLPEDQKVFQPWVSMDDWPKVLANFDIGLAPLSGGYDQRRSWIKVLEYMVMKIPWIASEGPAYHSLRPYGWLVNNTASSWERILLDMVDHLEDHRQEMLTEPYLYAISQSVDENIEKVMSIYSTIINKSFAGAIN
jgi:glycosyltransferase involved in cell wall biosynthesis